MTFNTFPDHLIRYMMSFVDIETRVKVLETVKYKWVKMIDKFRWWKLNECPDYDVIMYISCKNRYMRNVERCLMLYSGFIDFEKECVKSILVV